jgi:hypothetical protein
MKRKTQHYMGYTIFAVVVLALLITLTRGAPTDTAANVSSPYSQGALTALENSFDFGQIRMGDGTVAHQYTLANNTGEAVTIQKVYTSCMCTTAALLDPSGVVLGTFSMPGHGGASPAANIKVEPGHTVTVNAVFDPAAHGPSGVGLASRTVYLETNSAPSPKLELAFRAMVTR